MRLTSTRNPIVQHVRSLSKAGERHEHGEYLVEGIRLVSDARVSASRARIVLYVPELLGRSALGQSLLDDIPAWAERAVEVDERVLHAAALTETPSGVIAVLAAESPPLLASHRGARFGILLDGVTDPGNAGSILRTAAAVGVDFVVSSPGSVDLFAPKVVRAGMGAHFRLPLYGNLSPSIVLETLAETSLAVADADGPDSLFSLTWPARTLLVIGSEAHGVSPPVQARADLRLRIPMVRGVESLNAASAAAIIMYVALGATISAGT